MDALHGADSIAPLQIVLGDFNLDKAQIDGVLQSLPAKHIRLKSKLVPHIQHTTMSSATSIKCNDSILVSERLTVIHQSARHRRGGRLAGPTASAVSVQQPSACSRGCAHRAVMEATSRRRRRPLSFPSASDALRVAAK